MSISQLIIISNFSAQPATQSSADSSGMLERLIEILLNADIENIDRKLFGTLHNFIRKLAHFTNFFILGFICIMNADMQHSDHTNRAFAAVLLCSLISAAIDECHQLFVPGRSGEIRDVCIDFSGSMAACLLFIILKKVFRC